MKSNEHQIPAKMEKRFHISAMLDKSFKLFPREFLNSLKDNVKIVVCKNCMDIQ